LKVFANVKIAMQYFDNFGGGKCPKCPPPGCAPGSHKWYVMRKSLGTTGLMSTTDHAISYKHDRSLGTGDLCPIPTKETIVLSCSVHTDQLK